MNRGKSEPWETWVQRTAQDFPYPQTPNIASSVTRRLENKPLRAGQRPLRPAWALAVLAVLLAGLLAVPQVRAQIVEFIQIGVVHIFLVAPTPTPTGTPEASAAQASTRTPLPTLTLLPQLLDLSGKTSLEAAQEEAGFTIRLPAYPAGIGTPDHVFLQDLGGAMVVLVWMDPDRPERVELSLHQIGPGTFALEKVHPVTVEETRVNESPAAWTVGPYMLRLRNGNMDTRRLIDGHVLIWEEGNVTYRLETDLPLEEAVKIAESLH